MAPSTSPDDEISQLFRRTIKAGTGGIATGVHLGIVGGIINSDVRLKQGEFLRQVPAN